MRYVALLDHLVESAAAPPLTAAADAPSREALPPLVRRSWKKLARAGRGLAEASPDEDFHEVRKRAKQARYAAEAVAPAIGRARGPQARSFAEAAADLQDVLGDLQDSVVAKQAIEAFTAGGGLPPETGFAAGRLFERQDRAHRRARGDGPAVWRDLDRPRCRKWM
jgi:CHAD domain-containing protein